MATMKQIDLANAKKTWQSIETQRKIEKLYKNVANSIVEDMKSIPEQGTVSDKLREVYLQNYAQELNKEIIKIQANIADITKTGMINTAQGVVDANIDFMKSVGLDIKGAFSYVPTSVVEELLSGKVYAGEWTFSQALWGSAKKTQSDIYKVVATGVTQQKPTYEIAKDLEKYINPAAHKDWDWSKVYPGTNRKVDYSAQRLARTLIQHSYQLSYRRTIQYNPFVEGVIWHSALVERTCDLCSSRDGELYAKGQEPLDHPNGLCYLESYIPKSLDEIAEELADWANGESNPGIDLYLENAYNYKPKNNQQFPTLISAQRRNNTPWFSSAELADKALRGKSGELWRKASKSQRDSLYKYTCDSNGINRALRFGSNWKEQRDHINNITEVLSESTYPFDALLARGVDSSGSAAFLKVDVDMLEDIMHAGSADERQKAVNKLKSKVVGTICTDDAFMSHGSCKGAGFSRKDIVFETYAPSGTQMMYCEPFSYYGNGDGLKWDGIEKQFSFGKEQEVLVQRGTSTEILDVRWDEDIEKPVISMQVVDQNPLPEGKRHNVK